MTNIQKLLNKISNSSITKQNVVNALSARQFKTVFVFKNGILIDQVKGRDLCVKKYGITVNRIMRGVETNGYFFSYKNEYKPKKKQAKGGNYKTYNIIVDGKIVKTCFSRIDTANFLGCSKAYLWRSIRKKIKIKKIYDVEILDGKM